MAALLKSAVINFTNQNKIIKIMQFTLEKLTLLNFKGIKNLEVPCQHVTNIFGKNEAGKTTVMDAFLWLMFGKDSGDNKNFSIKTLDKNNNEIPRIEHTVIAHMKLDGSEVVLRKTLKDKWTKKRGAETEEFTGNETFYWWNDVPMQAGEYATQIDKYIKEALFKLITNPLYFNSLNWDKRRAALLQMAGELTDAQVAGTNPNFIALLSMLTNGKTMEQYKKEIREKINKLKQEKINIPARIDEVHRNKPAAMDWALISAEIEVKKNEIEQIDKNINNIAEAQKAANESAAILENKKFSLQSAMREISYGKKTELNGIYADLQAEPVRLRGIISKTIEGINESTRSLTAQRQKVEKMTAQKEQLLIKWSAIDDEVLTFDAGEFACPACKRPIEETAIELQKKTLTENFNTNKSERLNSVVAEGAALAAEIAEIDKTIEILKNGIAAYQEVKTKTENLLHAEEAKLAGNIDQQTALQNFLDNDIEYNKLVEDIKEIDAQITVLRQPAAAGNLDANIKKQNLQVDLDVLKNKLGKKEQITAADNRILELETEQESIVKQIADLERTDFTIAQFEKVRIETLENRINHKFKLVKFKMFEQQINGQEVECCHTLVNGVPFPDVNNAGKVNAGVDIINALCDHYNVYAPIFIDNRESVTTVIDSKSQQINLIVSPLDETLKIA